ncbi:TIGR03086 family metal-binding protein [Actinoplanes sp. NPDC049599]|uniref:TIGR03086 family metal-binding protein n=1 Tax=Actinoplanes sp. NPDC049599 TaxID=3363903 RepID=UPI0037BBBC13
MTSGIPARQLYARAMAGFDAVLHAVPGDRWTAPTPCAGWDVRALVDHVVREDRWAAELLAGRTIAEVGALLDGDLLGTDPVAAWAAASAAAASAATAAPDDVMVALSAGPTAVDEYLRQLAADHVVHAWDLATATGTNLRIEEDLIDAVTAWFAPVRRVYQAHGLVAPRLPVPGPAESQAGLLAMFGRSEALAAVERFGDAFDAKDINAIMLNMTPDCLFETTSPPDGVRHSGAAAVRAAWHRFFEAAGDHRFTPESRIVAGDQVIVTWRYEWTGGHVRGVDLFRVRDGLVAEKRAYVKG